VIFNFDFLFKSFVDILKLFDSASLFELKLFDQSAYFPIFILFQNLVFHSNLFIVNVNVEKSIFLDSYQILSPSFLLKGPSDLLFLNNKLALQISNFI